MQLCIRMIFAFLALLSLNSFSMEQQDYSSDSDDARAEIFDVMEAYESKFSLNDIQDPAGIRPAMESYLTAELYSRLGILDLNLHYAREERKIRDDDQSYCQERAGISLFLEQNGIFSKKKRKNEYFQERYNGKSKDDCPPITYFSGRWYRFNHESECSANVENKTPVIRILLENGCNPNPANHPLVVALAYGNAGAIQLLIEHGSHIKHAQLESFLNSWQVKHDISPRLSFGSIKRMRQELMFKAAQRLSIPIMEQLIETEGETVIQNRIGHALFFVLKRLHSHGESAVSTLRFLLAHGANPFYKSFYPEWDDPSLITFERYKQRLYISPYQWFLDFWLPIDFSATNRLEQKRVFHSYQASSPLLLDENGRKRLIRPYLAIMKEGRRQYLKPFVIKFAVLLKWLFEKQLKTVSFIPKDVALHIGRYCCDGYPED